MIVTNIFKHFTAVKPTQHNRLTSAVLVSPCGRQLNGYAVISLSGVLNMRGYCNSNFTDHNNNTLYH